jgi:hypothetical protein
MEIKTFGEYGSRIYAGMGTGDGTRAYMLFDYTAGGGFDMVKFIESGVVTSSTGYGAFNIEPCLTIDDCLHISENYYFNSFSIGTMLFNINSVTG